MPLFPVFLKLTGRRVLVVGGGNVAAGKLRALLEAGAEVIVVAPEIVDSITTLPVAVRRRPFMLSDLQGVSFVVAAAPASVNREVAHAADAQGIFVNAVDDVASASAYAPAILRRGGVTIAISTDGEAPALAGLLREAVDAVLPKDLDAWMVRARQARQDWIVQGVSMSDRRPLLLEALVSLYQHRPDAALGSQT